MDTVDAAIPSHVAHYLAVRHQIHHYLRWIGRGAEALDNIRVFQSHPDRDLLVKRLAAVDYVNELRRKEG